MVDKRVVKVEVVGEDRGASKALKGVADAADKVGPSGKVASNALDSVTSALTSGLGPAAGPAKDALDKIGASAMASGSMLKVGLAGGAVAAGAAIVALSIQGISSARDLNESLSKSNTIFAEHGKGIEKWAAGGARDFGLAKGAALDAAGTFGNMFTQLEIGRGTAADMSQKMVELAADFASFHNADITQVIEAQTAAFRGEYDAVQRFVPTINAATVEQKALEMGLAKTKDELTAQHKALATYTLLTEDTGEATGDFDRTAGELANQGRILEAQVENLRSSFGESLIPVLGAVADVAVPVLDAFTAITEKLGGLDRILSEIGKGMAESRGLGPILDVFSKLRKSSKETTEAHDAQAGSLENLDAKSEQAGQSQAELALETKKAKEEADKYQKKIDEMAGTVSAAYTTMSGKSSELTGKQGDLARSFDESKTKADSLKQGLDILVGVHLNAAQAAINWEEKLKATRTALSENRTTLDITTEAGRRNESAIIDMVKAGQSHIDALVREGASSQAVTYAYGDHVQALRNVMTQAGYSKEEIERLLERYGLLAAAPNIHKTITTTHYHREVVERLAENFGVPGRYRKTGGLLTAANGNIVGFKTKGPTLVGEGNPAHPEYVIATDPAYRQRNLRLLAAAASAMGGGGMASGGTDGSWVSAGGDLHIHIHAGTVVGANGAQELAQMVRNELLRYSRRVNGTGIG